MDEEDEVTETSASPTTPTDSTFGQLFGSDHHHLGNRILSFLLYNPKCLTLIISVGIFLFVVMLGIFICFCVKCLRRKTGQMSPRPSTGVYSTSSTFLPQPRPRALYDSQGNGVENKSSGKIMPHRNVITPDRSIAFVVPTVPTHIQGKCRHLHPGQPTCSAILKEKPPSGSSIPEWLLPPMLETQFFPQFQFEEKFGPQIGFSISYDHINQILQVQVLGGKNFPESGLSYAVHLKLYPGRGAKQRTKEVAGSNPLYNHEANFHVRRNALQSKVLKLRVIGSTGSGVVVGTKSLLGVVNLAMKDIPLVNHNEVTADFRTSEIWIELDHPLRVGEGVRLNVTLKWSNDPAPGLLVLKIREAQGLHEITEADYMSTYVKVTLQEQEKSIKSRKTRLIRWGSVPNYDDTFVVTVPMDLLSQVSFLLTLFARGRLGKKIQRQTSSKTILGKLVIGPRPESSPSKSGFGPGSGYDLWQDMCHEPNIEITRWLQLQP